MISCLLAMDRNQGIGYKNDLPWHLPEDLKYFKRVTMGHTIVMGRKTFDSIGKALPGRNNVIMTRDTHYDHPEGTEVIHSVDDLVSINKQKPEEEFFVIGGAEIFRQVLPFTDRLYITFIEAEYKTDTYFPKINWDEWNLVSSIPGEKQQEAGVEYEFRVYEKMQD
ncbi:dihydrofolate reductase [Bacillus oleivorans]|uniref:Dihydrofolate reductase n=1 Tax=Bacillus oleivorans TaxID=1448271 RepID=A0A285CL48_9BACI|nr:dihydrofolate reductase [Bacillus oleivorans]SNX68282.1 dihydrofolate reductase [Bacillus oleivorans]